MFGPFAHAPRSLYRILFANTTAKFWPRVGAARDSPANLAQSYQTFTNLFWLFFDRCGTIGDAKPSDWRSIVQSDRSKASKSGLCHSSDLYPCLGDPGCGSRFNFQADGDNTNPAEDFHL
jgi:hypothetical protein